MGPVRRYCFVHKEVFRGRAGSLWPPALPLNNFFSPSPLRKEDRVSEATAHPILDLCISIRRKLTVEVAEQAASPP